MTQEFTLASARRIKADLTLLIVSLIWGSAFVAQRVAATHMDIYLFNGMRFILGALVLLPLEWRTGRLNDLGRSLDRRTLLGVILAGMVLFIGASLQTLGMRFTTAGNAGFITGLYVVFVPILLAVGWRQWPRPAVLAAAGLAAVGMFLLSTGGHLRLAPVDWNSSAQCFGLFTSSWSVYWCDGDRFYASPSVKTSFVGC